LKSRRITYKDKRIFLADYTNLGFDLVALKAMLQVMTAFTGKAGRVPCDTLEEAQEYLVK
jgi:hypothetical protein